MTVLSRLLVQVFDHEGAPLQKAKVDLSARSGQGKSTKSDYSLAAGGYVFEGLAAGLYRIEVASRGLESQAREVEVTRKDERAQFHLGKKGMLSYFRGRMRIPVEPPEGLVAVGVRPDFDDKDEEALYRLAAELGLVPVETGAIIRDEFVRIFRAPEALLGERGREILTRLSAHDLVRRAGLVLSLSEDSVTFLTDEICVQFTEESAPKTAKAGATVDGYEVLRWLPYSPRTAVLRVAGGADFGVLAACDRFAARDDVVFAEPNFVTTVVPAHTPNDFLFAQQFHLPIISAEAAWDVTLGSEDIIVAVMDTGCDVNHPDFVTPAFTKIYQPFNFLGLNTNVLNNNSNHGTLSCGMVSAVADNAEGVSGVAPGCRIMPIRWPAWGTITDWADMYVWIAGLDPQSNAPGFPAVISPGADVISNSFGYFEVAIPQVMQDAFDTITDDGRGGLGCVVVFAAHNQNQDLTINLQWASYDRTLAVASSVLSPPDAAEVKTVTSNFGPAIDVCAPAGSPSETRSTSTANVGSGSIAGSATAATLDYALYSSTSCATPQVSGVAALILSICPDLTWSEVRDIIRKTADRIDVDNTDPVGQWVDNDGDGFPEFSQWYGYGRINAAAAVLEARRKLPIVAVNLEHGLEFGRVCGGPAFLTLQVFNVGEAELVISDVSILGGGTVFQVDPLPFTPLVIDPGSEVDFTVRYTPSAQGANDSAVLRIESNDPVTPEFDLDVTGAGGIATASLAVADSGNFGTVCAGDFVDRELLVNNSGTCPLIVTAITSDDLAFLLPMVVDFPLVIAAGDTLVLPLRFQPTTPGPVTATIRVFSNDPDSPAEIEVTGTRGEPRLVLSFANSGNFGPTCVGKITDKPLLLSNSGECDLRIDSISSNDAEFVAPTVISFPLIIGAGASASVTLRFQPISFGPKSATITVSSNDPTSPATFEVTGFAPSGKLVVTGSTCIGGVKACCVGERTISVCNVGDCALHVSSVGFSRKSKHWRLINNPFPATLHPGSCLGVLIRYKATEKCPRCLELVIKSDDPNTPVKTLDLLAYTVWDHSRPKTNCDDCCNGCCETHCDEGCSPQSIDACCFDEECDHEEDTDSGEGR